MSVGLPKLKLPVARLGSWFHEAYGTVSFTQGDFDAITYNFKNKRRGYEPFAYARGAGLDGEPYAKKGHNENGPGVYDNEEAEAHMTDIIQDGDVLFGIFDANNAEIVEKIDQGKFRYTSPEIYRKAKDRETGKPMGAFLRGLALTNTPTIPHLPRNSIVGDGILAEMLSDEAEIEPFLLELTDEALMTTPNTDAAVETETKTLLQGLTAAVAGLTAIFAAKPAAAAAPAAPAVAAETPEAKEKREAAEAEVARLAAEAEAAKADALAKAEQLTATTAELETLRAAAAEREAAEAQAAADAQAAAEAQAQADAEAEAARQAEFAAAAEADKAEKDQLFVQMLSDKRDALVAKGIAPVDANKAVAIIQAAKAGSEFVMLSEGAEPVPFEDLVFELLSSREGSIDYEQKGSIDEPTPPAGNPWLAPKRLAKLQSAPKAGK